MRVWQDVEIAKCDVLRDGVLVSVSEPGGRAGLRKEQMDNLHGSDGWDGSHGMDGCDRSSGTHSLTFLRHRKTARGKSP